MPTIDQRDALGVLTKPRRVEIASLLGLGLPGRLLKPELVDAIAPSPRAPLPPDPRSATPRRRRERVPATDPADEGRVAVYFKLDNLSADLTLPSQP